MSRRKVTVVGAGNVGATCAQRLAERDYADVVMVDALAGLATGKALDINQAGALVGYEPRVTAGGYEETTGSDVCVITAGLGRKPGMTREDLLARNIEIVDPVVRELARRSPDAILVVVTNPLDAMCHVALDASGFSRQRVIGMAGALDSARFRTFLASELGVSVRDVTALVLGGHGDTMVPAVSYATVGGVPVSQRIDPGRLEEIVQRTRDGGAEVIGHLERGGAYYAPSAGVVEIVDAIFADRRRVIACSALCQGEYGVRDLFLGVPCKLGAAGIEEIVEIELTPDEADRLRASADSVSELVASTARLRGG